MKKPNVLFIFTDQQRFDAIGYRSEWLKTPNLDRIASEGMRFDNCITNCPVCVPARVSLATGLYPHNHGIWNNCSHTLSPDSNTWMQVIRDLGYRTSLFGKTHLHPHSGDLRDREYLMNAYGIDDVYEIGGPRASAWLKSHMTEDWESKGLWQDYQDDYAERFSNKPHVVRPSTLPLEDYADVHVGQKAKAYLEKYSDEKPWMCWVSFGGPHEPWDAPEPYASMYKSDDMPEAAAIPKALDRPLGMLDEKLKDAPNLTEQDIKEMRANYAANVTLIDDQIGEILDVLEKRGELDDTIIVFASDHGELNGDYGLIYKQCFLKGCLNVPMIVRTPETKNSEVAGTVSKQPVELFDLGPTVVELAGGQVDYQQFATSLAPTIENPDNNVKTSALSEIDGEMLIQDEQWKMALNQQGEAYLLFNIQDDPMEQHNLAVSAEHEAIRNMMREKLLKKLIQSQYHEKLSIS